MVRRESDDRQRSRARREITINTTVLLSLIAVVFVIGALVGMQVGPLMRGGDSDGILDLGVTQFKYTHPLSERPVGKGALKELKPFRYKVKEFVDGRKDRGEATATAVYFRDLAYGTGFGINEKDSFAPAGLLRIPLMMAYFKWAESNPLILGRKVAVAEDEGGEQPQEGPSPPLRSVEPGKAYAVDDLIFRMIAHGDDRAFAALMDHLPAERLDRVFRDLYPDYDPGRIDECVTLSGYAPFFRVLYNASYLERDASERALDHLARPTNKNGIAAGVPRTVEVASSFGHGTIPVRAAADEQQVHDIGIVYHAGRPYLLGIIARGGDRKALEALLSDISRIVYREVDQQTK